MVRPVIGSRPRGVCLTVIEPPDPPTGRVEPSQVREVCHPDGARGHAGTIRLVSCAALGAKDEM